MALPWVVIAKSAAKYAPAAFPFVKKAAEQGRARLTSREKAITQAAQVGGRFAEVFVGDERFWVVTKDQELINCFPPCQDEDKLAASVGRLQDSAWKTPDALLRAKARERAGKLTRRKPKDPQS